MATKKRRQIRRHQKTGLKPRRRMVWLDRKLALNVQDLALPGTRTSTVLRTLLRCTREEIDKVTLSERLKQIAPAVWAAIEQRRKTPEMVAQLDRLVDEYLESIEANYAFWAKAYALILPLSPLTRIAVIIAGYRELQKRREQASGSMGLVTKESTDHSGWPDK